MKSEEMIGILKGEEVTEKKAQEVLERNVAAEVAQLVEVGREED